MVVLIGRADEFHPQLVPMSVEQIRPVIENAASQLVESVELVKELDRAVQEAITNLNTNMSTSEKLAMQYSLMIDRREGVARARAVSAAEFFGKLRSGPILIEALKHPASQVQLPAIIALGRMKYRPGANALVSVLRRKDLLGDNDLGERRAGRINLVRTSLVALSSITGLDFSKTNPSNSESIDIAIRQCEEWIAQHPE